MSSREPMWFCHECHAEMRPLMVPDPHCASCNGAFVEKLENPDDDPRAFQHAHDGFDDDALPENMDGFLAGLRSLMRGPGVNPSSGSPQGIPPLGSTRSQPGSPTGRRDRMGLGEGSGMTIRIQGSPDGRAHAMFINGSSRRDHVSPLFGDFISRGGESRSSRDDQNTIHGPLMAQYLLAMLGSRPGQNDDSLNDLLGSMFGMPGGAENGRWGDYVFNQEALDQIITQIMESSNASAPVAATEAIMENLPRIVLEAGSQLLEKDCAVCKEQFKLETEDPDEQVVVTLPCKHPFHEGCIMPWLKSSGTCPVCRYQLVPQPEHHTPGPGASGSGSGRPSSPNNPRQRPSSPGRGAQGGSGLFNLFGIGAGGGGSNGGATHTTRRRTQDANDPESHIPGGWGDHVD